MHIALAYGIEFAVQTVLIFAGLWIMIAVQKLNRNFLGLLGTAALTSALEMILDRWVGIYLSTSVIIGVMQVCIWKVTGSSNPFDVDVLFTVFVGGAVTFALNMFLIGALMGDLRASASSESGEEFAQIMADDEDDAETPVSATDSPGMARTNIATPTPAKSPPAALRPSKASEAALQSLTIKGLTLGTARPSAVLSDGKRTFTLQVGESRSLPTSGGTMTVKCERVVENTAMISVDGQVVKLTLR